jgi:hypothetical protein
MTPTCKSCIHPCKYERVGWCPNHTTRQQATALMERLKKKRPVIERRNDDEGTYFSRQA